MIISLRQKQTWSIQPNRETLLNHSGRLNHKYKTDDPKKEMQRRTIVKRNRIKVNSALTVMQQGITKLNHLIRKHPKLLTQNIASE